MTKTKSIAAALALLLLALQLPACASAPLILYGKTIDGQVVDAQTGQPIAGAHVMYLWDSASVPVPGQIKPSREVCYHAAAAVTDAQGRFHIAAWEKPQPYALPNREPYSWAYARGYVPDGLTQPAGPAREPTVHPNDVFKLTPSRATGDKRLEELRLAMRLCQYGGQSRGSLYPMVKAAYDETKSVAVTDKQKELVQRIARLVARAGIAADPTGDTTATEQRIERFIQENLQ